MANSNSFDVLSGYKDDEPSALIAAHLKNPPAKSPNPAKKPLVSSQPDVVASPRPPSEPFIRSRSVGSDDTEKNLLLERQFHRMFSLAEDGEFKTRPGCDGGGRDSGRRSHGGGGARRSYRSGSRFYCRPGRQYIDEEAEDYAVTMSSKYKIFDRHGPNGRGNLVKREGYGRWNWGSLEEEWLEENVSPNCIPTRAFIEWKAREKFFNDDENSPIEEDESEDEEMTLDEYERLMEEKKKAFQAMFVVVHAKRSSDENFHEQGLNESAKRTDNMEESAEDYVFVDIAEEDFKLSK